MTQAKLDTYLDLCTQVYDLSKPKPPLDAYEFYKSYVAQTTGPILEPMCGTGRFLLPLLADGFKVQGFDASQYMLDALHAKARISKLEPIVSKVFLEDFKSQYKYNLIFIPSGSFCLITDLVKAKLCLQNIYNLLSPDSLFVFEIDTVSYASQHLNLWSGHVYPREDNKLIAANFLDLPRRDNIANTLAKYELIDGQQVIKTEVEDYKVRLYEPEALRRTLEEIGFKQVKILKTFDKSKSYEQNDEVVVFECLN